MSTKLTPEYMYDVVNMCDLFHENIHLQPYSLLKNEFIDSVASVNVLFCYLE